MNETPKEISEQMSKAAKQRKNPYRPFEDKAYASEMGKRSWEKRVANAAKKAAESKDEPKGEDSVKSGQ